METLDASATDKPQDFTRYSTMENGFSRGNAEAEDEEKRFLGRRCAGRLWLSRRRMTDYLAASGRRVEPDEDRLGIRILIESKFK